MEEIKSDPNVGLDAAVTAVPELAKTRDTQAADPGRDDRRPGRVPSRTRMGSARSIAAGWTTSIAYMGTLKLIKDPVTTDDLVREDLLPAGD